MSTSAEEPRQDGFFQAFGHYYEPLYPFLMLIGSVWAVLYPSEGWGLDDPFGWALAGVTLLGLYSSMRWHTGKLCERCMAAVPLNAAEKAEKFKRHFRFVHRYMGSLNRLLTALLVIVCFGLAVKLVFDPPRRVNSLIHLFTFAIPMAYTFWAMYRHNHFQPWCPYCRRDDGDDETEEVPDPSPAASL